MLERLVTHGARRAEALRRRVIARLAASATPPGLTAEAAEGGVRLSGRRLKMRLIREPQLRMFGR